MEVQEFLVKQAVDGSRDAFAKLYECIYRELYRYAWYMLGNVQDAEDVVSETVIDLYRGLGNLRDHSLFRNYAFKILSNKCKMMRKKYLDRQLSLDDENLGLNLRDKERDLEQRCDIEKALKLLEEEDREIILLTAFGGYTSEEVGKILGMKSATVRSRLKRSLKKMKGRMEVLR